MLNNFIILLIGSLVGAGYIYVIMSSVIKKEQLSSYIKGYVAAHSKAYYEGWEQCKQETLETLQRLNQKATTEEEFLFMEFGIRTLEETLNGKESMDSM